MCWLALVSFAFWAPVFAGVDLPSVLARFRVPIEANLLHIGVHNFHSAGEVTRNSGMFGEPGQFAGYLVLALLLAIGETGPTRNRKLLVLIAGVLSTQSTTGYIALGLTLLILAVARRLAEKGRLGYLTALPALAIVVAVGSVAFETLPFMKAKILHQQHQVATAEDAANITRLGNLLFDLEYIRKRPVAGWSPRHETRAAEHSDILELAYGQGNGLSGFAVKFGLVGLLLFCVATYEQFFRKFQSVILGFSALSVIAVLLTGEQFLDGPLFLTLLFLPNLPIGELPACEARIAD
jgi:O-antigen ligase